jgi:hypothetical protein
LSENFPFYAVYCDKYLIFSNLTKTTPLPSKKPIHLRLFYPSRNAAEAQAFAFSIPQKKRQLSIAILIVNH